MHSCVRASDGALRDRRGVRTRLARATRAQLRSLLVSGILLAPSVAAATGELPRYAPSGVRVGAPVWASHANAPSADPPGVVNGGFETGTFAGWTTVDQVGGSGSWIVYSGTVTSVSGSFISAPPEGTFAATSDQTGPGSHILYQDLILGPGAQLLHLFVYYDNQAGFFATPPTLDYNVFPNQQYRIDIMNPAAPVDSVAASDVLADVFHTSEGDPPFLPPTPMEFDLTPFAGTTVRLRFAEVDNQFFFQASTDAVGNLCGNGLTELGEQCDNGTANGTAAGCCSSTCQPTPKALGGDDSGCIPPDKATRKCEQGVASATAKLVTATIDCHIARARGELVNDATSPGIVAASRVIVEDVCEGAARNKLLATKIKGCGQCTDLPALAGAVETLVDGNNDLVYCTSAGGAFGGEDSGNIPPDAPTGPITKCENGVAKEVGKLAGAIVKCHVSRASGKLADDAEENACEETAETKFTTKTKTTGCDSCTSLTSIADFVETAADRVNYLVFCASPSGAFLEGSQLF
jgi:hypothetical protein